MWGHAVRQIPPGLHAWNHNRVVGVGSRWRAVLALRTWKALWPWWVNIVRPGLRVEIGATCGLCWSPHFGLVGRSKCLPIVYVFE